MSVSRKCCSAGSFSGSDATGSKAAPTPVHEQCFLQYTHCARCILYTTLWTQHCTLYNVYHTLHMSRHPMHSACHTLYVTVQFAVPCCVVCRVHCNAVKRPRCAEADCCTSYTSPSLLFEHNPFNAPLIHSLI